MRLANTGGKNLGKKYLKITGEETITPDNQKKYNKYKSWVSSHFDSLSRQIKGKSIFNPDVFNDTYIKIGSKILYGGLDIDNYAAYFSSSYYTNYFNSKIATDKVDRSKTNIEDDLLVDTEVYDIELDGIIPNVQSYVAAMYEKVKSDIFFDYYCNINENHTFRSIAKKYHVSLSYIHKTIVEILRDLKSSHHINQYKPLSS